MAIFTANDVIGEPQKRGAGVDIPFTVQTASKPYVIAHGLGRIPRAAFVSMSEVECDLQMISRDAYQMTVQFDAAPANLYIRVE